MPRQPTEHAYNIPRLNVWFLVGNVLLLGTLIWLIMADYHREWKDVQRGFMQLERQRVNGQLDDVIAQRNAEQLADIQQELAEGQQELEAHQAAYATALEELNGLKGTQYGLDQKMKFAKAELAVYKYELELAREDPTHHDLAEAKEVYDRTVALLDDLDRQSTEFAEKFRAAKARVAEFTEKVDTAKKKLNRIMDDQIRLETKKTRLDDTYLPNKIRDAPMLDFMDPRVKIQQILLFDLVEDLNMGTTMRIDRCITCHQGIDQKAYDGAREPYGAHPRLAEFVASHSPHPKEKFGCTICHSGRPRGTTFQRTAHWPDSPEQEHDWEEQYDWHAMHYWDYDQLPMRFIEASCYQCHQGQTKIEGAPKWNRGIRLMELNGCFGCHKVVGYENVRKAGPALRKIATKTTPDWAYNWIRDPKGFRPQTRMPQLFDLENINDAHNRALTTAGINAMVTYLWEKSEQPEVAPIPVEGDPAHGEWLLHNVGCMACHQIGPPEVLDRTHPRTLGPNLANLGSKVQPEWLYHWLKNPHAYFPQTWMPNLRLSDQEAADLTAFLTQGHDPEFESRPRPDSPPEARDELMMHFLAPKMSPEDARAKIASMTEHEQDVFLGEHVIRRNGCFGCHDIPGFEHEQRIGTELTEEGSKDVARFDFGLIPSSPEGRPGSHAYSRSYEHPDEIDWVPHTRQDWIMTKLLRPRIWDRDRVKSYDEKLKMPWFSFTPDEAEAITTAVLSFQKSLVPKRMRYQMSPERLAIAKGRWVVQNYNCKGCHVIEGEGRAIAATIENESMWPPILTGEGRKAQTQWLFDFLIKPVTVRPWLNVRMPTFGFTGAQSNTIVEYFSRLDKEAFPSVYYDPEGVTQTKLQTGHEMFTTFKCQQCHVLGEIPEGVDTASLAPNLLLAHDRLKPDWVSDWILGPQNIAPGTKMPTFWPEGDAEESPYPWFENDAREQADAIRDYIFVGLRKDYEQGAAE